MTNPPLSNVPPKGGMDRIRAATARAQAFLDKANSLNESFLTIVRRENLTYLGGKTTLQFMSPEGADNQPEQQQFKEALEKLGGLLEAFDKTMGDTDRNAESARASVPDDDPVAGELEALRAEIRKIGQEAAKWRGEETASLGVGPESVERPSDFSENRVDGLERLLQAFERWAAEDSSERTPDTSGVGRLVDTARRRVETPPPPPPSPPPPTESRLIPPVTETRTAPPAGLPDLSRETWPTTEAEFRRQFTFTVERFGTREHYARHLADRLNTTERINQFMENMFRYTRDRDQGQRQRMINKGPDAYEPNERWVPPLEFLTTYNSEGRMYGDCDDIGLAFAYIAQLQGKAAFAIETSTSTRDASTGALDGKGHVMAAWFEADGSLRIVDTTGNGRRQAGIQVVQRRPGETDEQLLERGYQEGRVGPNPIDTRSLSTVISLQDGSGVNLPGNLALCRRHAELQPLLEARNYRAVIAIVDQEIARAPSSLDLRLAKIQLLMLAGAPRAEVRSVVRNLSGVDRHTVFNQYAAATARNVMLNPRPQYVWECNMLTAHCNGTPLPLPEPPLPA